MAVVTGAPIVTAVTSAGSKPGITLGDLLSEQNCPITGKYNQQFWAAISCAEDGDHDPEATNHNTDGSTDVGLWMINTVHSQYFPNGSLDDMKDPHKNCAAAKAISNNWTNPHPWSTFNEGKEVPFNKASSLDEVVKGTDTPGYVDQAASTVSSVVSSGFDTLVSPIKALIEFAQILFDPNTWFRAGKVMLGGILILIVAYMAIRSA